MTRGLAILSNHEKSRWLARPPNRSSSSSNSLRGQLPKMICAVCAGALGEDIRTIICGAGHEHLIHGTSCFEELKQRNHAALPKKLRLRFPVRRLNTNMMECPRPGCIKRLTSTSQRGAAVPDEQAVVPPAAGERDDGCPYCSRPLASACRIVCCSIPEHRRTYHEKCFEKHKLRAYRAGSQKYAFDRMKDDQVGCAVNRCSGKLETVVSTKLLAFSGSGGGGAAAAASVEDGDSAASTCALCSEALCGHCVDTYCGLHAHTVHQACFKAHHDAHLARMKHKGFGGKGVTSACFMKGQKMDLWTTVCCAKSCTNKLKKMKDHVVANARAPPPRLNVAVAAAATGNRHPWPRPAPSITPPRRQLFFPALGSPLLLFRRFPTGQGQWPHCYECSQPTLGSSCPVIHIFCGKNHHQLVHADCLESYTDRLEKNCLAASNRWAAARHPRSPHAPAPPAARPRITALTISPPPSCAASTRSTSRRCGRTRQGWSPSLSAPTKTAQSTWSSPTSAASARTRSATSPRAR